VPTTIAVAWGSPIARRNSGDFSVFILLFLLQLLHKNFLNPVYPV